MFHSSTRKEAIQGLHALLTESHICGPPTNMEFLADLLSDDNFVAGNTLTRFLDNFQFNPSAIEVISGGSYTLIEDWGRPTIGKGFCHSGPMDSVAFRIANALVGNPVGLETLEITLSGPDLRFLRPAVVSLCGAAMVVQLDGAPIPMWSRVKVSAGQRLTIGKATGPGCRAYLAVFGGFLNIAKWFGSKSTSPMVGVGGYQGRQLASGDILSITTQIPDVNTGLSLPDHLIPKYPNHWELLAMPGPYDEGYISPESIGRLYETDWKVSHNAARGGIRLIGPNPQWARSDGGEGGAHPSNLIEYGYPMGTINWTGDDPVMLPVDCPDFGGFVSSHTVVKADLWKLGQVKAGDTIRYRAVSWEDAYHARADTEGFVDGVVRCCVEGSGFNSVHPLGTTRSFDSKCEGRGSGVVHSVEECGGQPLVSYRQVSGFHHEDSESPADVLTGR